MTRLPLQFEPSELRSATEQRILVVDHDWVNIQMTSSVLGAAGYEIIPALNGPQALAYASSRSPDLILLELAMPGMDGCEVCRRLRLTAEGRDIPVIFLSTDDKDLAVRALAAGGADCIARPYHPGELLGRVRAHLALKSTRDDLRKLADEKDELLGILAHDLKNLLGGINLSAELAQGRLARTGDQSLPALAGEIAKTSARLLTFVNKFLTTAAVNHGTAGGATASTPARVLVANGQTAQLRRVGAALGHLECEIVHATSGRGVLEQIRERVPELVLLSANLPGGFEICRQLRAAPDGGDVPVIILSPAGNGDFAAWALEAGAIDYVRGPFHPVELALRVETQLSLKLGRDKLARLAAKRNHLLGLLARGFRTRLESMGGNAQSLRALAKNIGDGRMTQLVENLSLSNSHLLEFVTRLQDQAATGRRLTLRPVPMSLRRAIAGAIKRFLEPARAKDVSLRFEPQLLEDDLVLADEMAVNRVLDNLLSNAVKFSPPKTTIRLSTFSTGGEIQCRIIDQGPGFTNEDKARMFGRFSRLSSRPTGGESSTGLGLSIVRRLVRAMHGEVTCQSSPGRGAAFTIGFPRLQTSRG